MKMPQGNYIKKEKLWIKWGLKDIVVEECFSLMLTLLKNFSIIIV
jgi:hypothetical protein